jgi:hypothetical protein
MGWAFFLCHTLSTVHIKNHASLQLYSWQQMIDSVQALDPIMLSNRTTLVITGGTSTDTE